MMTLLCAAVALEQLPDLLFRQDTAGLRIAELVLSCLAVVFGMSSWTLFRAQATKRGWVIAASLLNILAATGPLALYLWFMTQGIRVHLGLFSHAGKLALIPMVFGIAGLFAFPRERSAAKGSGATPPS